MPTYIVGPSDNQELSLWSTELGQRLAAVLDDLSVRIPVQADELTKRLLPLVEAEVKEALADASSRHHLEREQVLKFQLFMSRAGKSGLLSFNYRVDLDPFRLSCTDCTGMVTSGAALLDDH